MGVCEGVLGRQVLTMDESELRRRLRLAEYEEEEQERIPWQLQVQAFIAKPPHQAAQQLHRDGEYLMLQVPAEQIEHEVSVIWATHDFTNALGATRVVKGSHRWPRERRPRVSEACGAEMPKGSCLIYAGHTLHGPDAHGDELQLCSAVPEGGVSHGARGAAEHRALPPAATARAGRLPEPGGGKGGLLAAVGDGEGVGKSNSSGKV